MEIDLLKNYPKATRDLKARAKKTEEDRYIARQFGYDFFDGDRKHGYGGFHYNEKYWGQVVQDFIEHYNLAPQDKILDVGCAKGFMLYDFIKAGMDCVLGVDVSEYAVLNAPDEVRPHLMLADAKKLPFLDRSFDLVISINTIHNLGLDDCFKAVQEIERVSGRHSFIVVDAFKNLKEKKRMLEWNLTAKTIMSVSEWRDFFDSAGYTGDYYWFTP